MNVTKGFVAVILNFGIWFAAGPSRKQSSDYFEGKII